MDFSILSILTALSIISVSTLNVSAATQKIRIKRMSNSESDFVNIVKYEARIVTQDSMCTGSIISDKFILTAAHCIVKKGNNQIIGIDRQVIEVTVGIKMVNNHLEQQTVRLVERIYIPRYFVNIAVNFLDLKNMIGDIAVLKLNHRLGLGIDWRIEALSLPTYDFVQYSKKMLLFAGFGGTEAVYNGTINDYEAGEFPQYLQFSKVQVLPSNQCDLGNVNLKMCAKFLKKGAGTCGGDSGGALIDYEKKTIIGVLSYGSKMCDGAIPGVYTRVFPYKCFIMAAMNDHVDEIAVLQNFEYHPNYVNALEQNLYKYHFIYGQVRRHPNMIY